MLKYAFFLFFLSLISVQSDKEISNFTSFDSSSYVTSIHHLSDLITTEPDFCYSSPCQVTCQLIHNIQLPFKKLFFFHFRTDFVLTARQATNVFVMLAMKVMTARILSILVAN